MLSIYIWASGYDKPRAESSLKRLLPENTRGVAEDRTAPVLSNKLLMHNATKSQIMGGAASRGKQMCLIDGSKMCTNEDEALTTTTRAATTLKPAVVVVASLQAKHMHISGYPEVGLSHWLLIGLLMGPAAPKALLDNSDTPRKRYLTRGNKRQTEDSWGEELGNSSNDSKSR